MLFTPFAIGPLTLKNRLVALPVFTGYALPDGRVSDLLIGHYASLAESGVAMVVVANAAVSADGVVAVNNLRIDRDNFIPALARLARAIQQRGALAVLQLNHGGRFAKTEQPLSPSALDTAHIPFNIASLKDFMNFFPLEERFGLTRDFMQRLAAWTQPMLAGQREGIATAFGDAAARAHEAGFDAVELHGATGYLLTQFLSAFTHKDLSGAALSFSARMHYPVRVVQEVKRRLPAGFPLGFRLLLREWVPGGIDLAEALDFAARLEAEGVSYFSPSVGTYQSMFTPEVRTAMSQLAYLREDALALKKRVRTPVIVSGRVQTPALAEQLLAEGAGDLIGLGRVLRVDPEWVAKARAGKAVRACRDCYLCLKRVVLDQGFMCVRWSRWQQARTDLEQRLLKRDLYRSLWVAAGSEDLDALRGPMAAAMIPARPGIRTTVLVRRLQGPADEEVGVELIQGGYGTVLFARNPAEPWRERFLYRHRAKAVCLLGSHPGWSKVLIALDLGLVSLFVLRNLAHTLMPNPVFKFDFIHVLQGKEVEARRRWDEIRRILGWEEQAALRLVPPTGNVAGDILRELRTGGHGTLVMGKSGLSRIKRLFLGSVSAAVLQGLDTQSLILID